MAIAAERESPVRRVRPFVSLTDQVAFAVWSRGPSTIDDLQPLFPHLQRHQLQKALQNASNRRLIQIAVRGVGGHKPVQAVWERHLQPPPAPAYRLPTGVATCVWELAEAIA